MAVHGVRKYPLISPQEVTLRENMLVEPVQVFLRYRFYTTENFEADAASRQYHVLYSNESVTAEELQSEDIDRMIHQWANEITKLVRQRKRESGKVVKNRRQKNKR